jgi:membrane-associated protein
LAFINWFIDFIMHLDTHLGNIISQYGVLAYSLLFGVIFVETGLVVTPFLPGDSLLFVAGAFAALGKLNLVVLLVSLSAAAILGDSLNYTIGHFLGEKAVANPHVPINERQLKRTEEYFRKHGGKTIILARFIPFIRTFAPFVAGAGRMHYGRFIIYNAVGGIAWVTVGLLAGYFFGNIPFIKSNFSLFLIGIVLVSLVPIGFELFRERARKSGKQ